MYTYTYILCVLKIPLYDKNRISNLSVILEKEAVNYIFVCILISRSWCPDRTLSQARKYIASSLHEKYTEPVILNLRKTWEESDMRTPLICFLSMGSDPTDQINSLCRKLNLGMKVIIHCHVLRQRGTVGNFRGVLF